MLLHYLNSILHKSCCQGEEKTLNLNFLCQLIFKGSYISQQKFFSADEDEDLDCKLPSSNHLRVYCSLSLSILFSVHDNGFSL